MQGHLVRRRQKNNNVKVKILVLQFKKFTWMYWKLCEVRRKSVKTWKREKKKKAWWYVLHTRATKDWWQKGYGTEKAWRENGYGVEKNCWSNGFREHKTWRENDYGGEKATTTRKRTRW
jgi:hypothetical protein